MKRPELQESLKMKLLDHQKPNWLLLLCSAALLLSLSVKQHPQTTLQMPAPSGHVNDFARVVDETTKQQLENILTNVKLKTGIEFDVVTVESTAGQDIFDFSRQLAKEWNIGVRTSSRKSLLLVISVNEKTSFTQFSKAVQNDLPEGVLGEMSQLMRGLIDAGKFNEGLNAGVQHFVKALGQKLALNTDDFDKTPEAASATTPSLPDNSLNKPTDEAAPAITRTTKSETGPATVKTSARRSGVAATRTRKPDTGVDDEAESEEVELTLTKPLADRIVLLRAFLNEHPESKSKERATELLVSAHAALGDQRLKNGDSAGGIEQLMLAIAEAPVNSSEKLFAGVISQVPLNLYLRGETEVAAKAAQNIEAKFGNDSKRLVALSGFYTSTEQGAEATRLAKQAVQLAPDLAEAHQALGRALHISLRLDEAAAEYKRALELDPSSKAARRSLADLDRSFGKADEALALYRQQLDAEPNDKAARTGLILSLLELGRSEEAKGELDKALQADPRNLNLLAGAAYWFAAHNDSDAALNLGQKAVEIEPRYTWSQVALARALIAQKRPLEAERALRFARQYGKFPTLDYELASALAAAGLYEEAAEVLMQSFSVKDGQIETRLGGQASARGANFIDLLAPERRASIFQAVAADTANNAKLLKALLMLTTLLNQETNGGTIDEGRATAAANEFASGDDAARVHRQLYAASRLLQKGVGFQTAYELAEAARNSAEAGLSVPALTLVVQADEFRMIRARAITAGGTPEIPEAPRNVLSNLLRGRIEDVSGWALFSQDKLDDAVEHLQRAVTILPEGTPAARTALWHLGAALERQDKKREALSYYIKSYNAGEPDSVRRAVIEQLYRKINGSLDGLDARIGPASATQVSTQTPVVAPEPAPPTTKATPETTDTGAQPASSPESTPATAPARSMTPVGEPAPTPAVSAAPASVTPSPGEPTSSPAPTPTPDSTVVAPAPGTPGAASSASMETSPVEKMDKPPRATVTISGRVKDASDNPIANVVVVFISPLGTVLAATTDEQGNYSFTVAASTSTRSYRIIPSRDGFTFDPIDKTLPVVNDDQKELNFVGRPVTQSG
jgi:tetratricopeptide (TPR) repeat protein/uncharacterized membrane protein YgcG